MVAVISDAHFREPDRPSTVKLVGEDGLQGGYVHVSAIFIARNRKDILVEQAPQKIIASGGESNSGADAHFSAPLSSPPGREECYGAHTPAPPILIEHHKIEDG